MDGFDLESPLVCEGIIGDGCGGGRIFFIESDALQVYDPTTKKRRVLLEEVNKARSLSKMGCKIIIILQEREIEFDLSSVDRED